MLNEIKGDSFSCQYHIGISKSRAYYLICIDKISILFMIWDCELVIFKFIMFFNYIIGIFYYFYSAQY